MAIAAGPFGAIASERVPSRSRRHRHPQLSLAAEPRQWRAALRRAGAETVGISADPRTRHHHSSDFNGAAADGKCYANKCSGKSSHRILDGIGHNVPQEASRAFADAIVDVDRL
jgi:hypothetical protein